MQRQTSEPAKRMTKILNYRIGQEQTRKRRLAICRQALHTTQTTLVQLDRQWLALRQSHLQSSSHTASWYQQRQRALAALSGRIAQVRQEYKQLQQQAHHRQAELMQAAQLRRATHNVAQQLHHQAQQAVHRAETKRFDNLIRSEQLTDRIKLNATIT